MKIVVCVKETVDTAAVLSLQDGAVYRGDASLIINPWDEFAVETALQLVEENGGDVVAVSVSAGEKNEALKHSLAMGCREVVQVKVPAGTIQQMPAAVLLAAAIRKIPDVDLLFFGRQSTDEESGVTAVQAARLLNWPALTHTAKVLSCNPDGQVIEVERLLEEGRQKARAALPAVVSVVKEICEPRYPSFMGIRKAARVEVPQWDFSDLGVDPGVSWKLEGIRAPESREGEVEMVTGADVEEQAARLLDRLVEEKVL